MLTTLKKEAIRAVAEEGTQGAKPIRPANDVTVLKERARLFRGHFSILKFEFELIVKEILLFVQF